MLTIRKLRNRIEKIQDAHSAINSGGCGCMAVMLAEALEDKVENLRIRSCGGYCSKGDLNIDEIRLQINNYDKSEWMNAGVGFAHVWTEFLFKGEWYAVDSTGVYPLENNTCLLYKRWASPLEGSFTIKEMGALANTPTWNSDFNREQLPSMQKMVNSLIATL